MVLRLAWQGWTATRAYTTTRHATTRHDMHHRPNPCRLERVLSKVLRAVFAYYLLWVRHGHGHAHSHRHRYSVTPPTTVTPHVRLLVLAHGCVYGM